MSCIFLSANRQRSIFFAPVLHLANGRVKVIFHGDSRFYPRMGSGEVGSFKKVMCLCWGEIFHQVQNAWMPDNPLPLATAVLEMLVAP